MLHSASLAGVAEDADATPANLGDAGTYRLPGLFAPSTSVSWLRQRFGKANVHVADVPGGEGETSRGVILFPDDAARRAYLYFQDEKRLRGLSMVRVMDEGSRWQLDNGVAIGMPLSRLQALNGRRSGSPRSTGITAAPSATGMAVACSPTTRRRSAAASA